MPPSGTIVDLADTSANVAAFGRPVSRGQSAWPPVHVMALCECSTHILCDAGDWRYDTDWEACARRLLRSVTPEMPILCDQGLYSFDTIQALHARNTQVLVRIPWPRQADRGRHLADGTLLVRIAPSDGKRRRWGEHLLLRLSRSTIDEPHRPGHRVEHRLLTYHGR